MKSNHKIYVGQKINCWEVLSTERFYKKRQTHVRCRCECGRESLVGFWRLVNSMSRQCAPCGNLKRRNPNSYTQTPEYKVWQAMRDRCANKNNAKYARYGGRGITFDPRWKSFFAFHNDMGDRPSDNHSIDRIDNNKGYYKENCRWTTQREQTNNRENTTFLTFNGETLPFTEFANRYNINRNTLYSRLYLRDWSIEEALTTPVNSKCNYRFKEQAK